MIIFFSFFMNIFFVFLIIKFDFILNFNFKNNPLRLFKPKKVESSLKSQGDVVEFLDFLVVSLDSGLNIRDSLCASLNQMKDSELKKSINSIIVSQNLGYSISDALDKTCSKLKNGLIKYTFESIAISIKFGSPLKEVLERLSNQTRQNMYFHLEEIAGKAPVKMIFPLVLFIFPVIFILLGTGALRDFISVISS